jgi:hypothetical protein
VTHTTQQIRGAILSTAALFEREPDAYGFFVSEVPECGSRGCMLGFIMKFLGMPVGTRVDADGLPITERRLYKFCREYAPTGSSYMRDARMAAAALRAFADAEYPAAPSIDPAFARFKALLANDVADALPLPEGGR